MYRARTLRNISGAKMVAYTSAQMMIANTFSSIIFTDFAMIAMKYANSARPTIAQPTTQREGPTKGPQRTFVRMQGPMPIRVPFQKASNENRSFTGIAQAKVHAKNRRMNQQVRR